MKPAELLALLEEFYRDRLRLMIDHQASARGIGHYHVNNTYQYVVARAHFFAGALAGDTELLGPARPAPVSVAR